jgi:hypothetical protein
MANEFKIKNGLVSDGNIVVTGSITATGGINISGSIASAETASFAPSYTLSSSFNSYTSSASSSVGSLSSSVATTTSGLASRIGSVETKTGSYATTGSNIFIGDQTITGSICTNGNIVTTGQIVAQTINVQQVTSSIVYSCGSNIFGNVLSNTQQFTGSILATGSLTLTGPMIGSSTVCGVMGNFSCVGVGTTNPGAQLEVMSTTGGTLRLKRDDGTVTTDEVLGTVEFYTNDGDGPHVASYIKGLGADFAGQNYGRYGALSFGVSKIANTDAVEVMRIDLTGAVGINCSNPSYTLDVNGTGRFCGNLNGSSAVFSSYINMGSLVVNDPGSSYYSFTNRIGGSTAINVNSINVNSDLGKFLSSGLSINSGGGATNNMYQIAFGYKDASAVYASSAIAGITESSTGYNTGALIFATRCLTTDTAPIEKMRITAAGNIGIGTCAPQSTLHIGPSLNSMPAATSIAVPGDTSIRFMAGSDGNANYGSFIAGTQVSGVRALSLGSRQGDGDIVTMTLTEGNVGIGLTSPGNRLQVNHPYNGTGTNLYLYQPCATWGSQPSYNAYKFISTCSHPSALDGIFKSFNVGPGGVSIGYTQPPTYNCVDALYVCGNVGINTVNPSATLDVNGSIRSLSLHGKLYSQTSSSGTTSFINTGLFYSSFGTNSVYLLTVSGNPNGAGSGQYTGVYVGYVYITSGYAYSLSPPNVAQYINYTQVVTGDSSIGTLTISAVFWNGSTETTIQNDQTANNQIRIKVTGYNSGYVGQAQTVQLTKIN